jgi:hypothetical protein
MLPFLAYSISSIICSIGPYWWPWSNMCWAKAESSLLSLLFLMCSLCLVIKFRSVCPTYTLWQLWQVSLCIPLCSYVFVMWLSLNSLPTVVVVLNATFKFASLNTLWFNVCSVRCRWMQPTSYPPNVLSLNILLMFQPIIRDKMSFFL